jgi:thioredoxin 1
MAGNLRDFNDGDFDSAVMQSDKPVLVDFWAPWCGPCKAMTPTIEDVAAEVGDAWVVGKMDIQANPQIAGKLGIRSIPALMFFEGGACRETLVGTQSKDKILETMKKVTG